MVSNRPAYWTFKLWVWKAATYITWMRMHFAIWPFWLTSISPTIISPKCSPRLLTGIMVSRPWSWLTILLTSYDPTNFLPWELSKPSICRIMPLPWSIRRVSTISTTLSRRWWSMTIDSRSYNPKCSSLWRIWNPWKFTTIHGHVTVSWRAFETGQWTKNSIVDPQLVTSLPDWMERCGTRSNRLSLLVNPTWKSHTHGYLEHQEWTLL